MENIRHKVILHSRVDLDDVASLASNVQVVDGSTFFKIIRARANSKGVGPRRKAGGRGERGGEGEGERERERERVTRQASENLTVVAYNLTYATTTQT